MLERIPVNSQVLEKETSVMVARYAGEETVLRVTICTKLLADND